MHQRRDSCRSVMRTIASVDKPRHRYTVPRMAPDQTPPEWVYVFVDPNNSMAVMNLEITGRYTSSVLAAISDDSDFAAAYIEGRADFLPFVPNVSVSTGFMSPFTVGTINDYRVEYDAELARRTYFKNAPSRLTGIFAFASMDDCREVNKKWPWGWPLDTVKRFRIENVLRATRVNMEIVSLARCAYRRGMLSAQSIEDLWRAYWSGEDDYPMDLPTVDGKGRETKSAGTTWEWIIDGALIHEHESRVA